MAHGMHHHFAPSVSARVPARVPAPASTLTTRPLVHTSVRPRVDRPIKQRTVDMDKVFHEWRARGYSCDMWSDPPANVWHHYRSQLDGLLMLISGDVVVEVQGKTLRPKVGEEVFIPANTIHSVHSITSEGSRWLYGHRRFA